MKILALDTSTDACSVALSCDDEIAVDHRIAPQKHAQLLLPMIETMLSNAGLKVADLDGVAFGCGPGSFTGVRIAAATTQGICFGANIGAIAVSSLQALAQSSVRENNATHTLAAFDARMGEVYWGAYAIDNEGVMQSQQDDCVCAPNDVALPNSLQLHEWQLVGSGSDVFIEELKSVVDSKFKLTSIAKSWPNAQDVLAVAMQKAKATGFQDAKDALPVYLRDRVALTEKERAAGERL